MRSLVPPDDLDAVVQQALHEDIQSGDLHHELMPHDLEVNAHIICRDDAILSGRPYAEAVFKQVDPRIQLEWHKQDGEAMQANDVVVTCHGPAHTLLTAERTAINFLQTLSGTATATHHMVQLLAKSNTTVVDTRKTIPGLRTAQKYAVRCGGGTNHRMGLYDAFLIKENHILAAGSIAQAAARAEQRAPDRWRQVEVENLDELQQALNAGFQHILLDNFTLDQLREAVQINQQRAELEASGGITKHSIQAIAATGVDRISIGSLTKNIQAVDFSMRISHSTVIPRFSRGTQ